MSFIKKFIALALIIISVPGLALAADTETKPVDNIAALQLEISNDIGKLRETINNELADLKLGSTDIEERLKELAILTETASDDMTAWGYTDTQRERRIQVLSELSVAYTAYASAAYGRSDAQAQDHAGTASSDAAAKVKNENEIIAEGLGAIESPDINTSDNLRQEITKTSRGIDMQLFALQSKINKLKLDLSDSARMRKEIQTAQEGGEAIEIPRTHALEFENARLNAALSAVQVRRIRAVFDKDVALVQRLRRRLASIQDNLIFPEELLDANIQKLQERIDALAENMSGARRSLNTASSALTRARNALRTSGLSSSENITPEYANLLARQARLNYWEYMTTLIDDEIKLIREEQHIWRSRYKLFNDQATGDEIWKIRDSTQKRIAELQRLLDGMRTTQNDILRQISSMQTRLEAKREGLDESDGVKIHQNLTRAIDVQRKIILDILNRYEAIIPQAVFLQQRLYNEASDRVSAIRIAEKVESFSKETIMGFLDTELWQGEGYSVTVGKLIIAVLVFLSSFFLSSLGSHWIKRRMLKRGVSVTASNGTQRIVFYILWITFALIALNIVKIPLTAFAFMGGAMAVGIGFGMQNIFNNLISGFIVIFSRPFKVHDIIEVAGNAGTVQDIGSRSTTIKTWDGLDVILPNRYFLENSVTNWTGSDMKRRNILKVQVSYDSDTRQVEKLLLKVVKSHSKVLNDPAPFVVFSDFDASGLNFDLYFWIDLREASAAKVASDMRHYIFSLFNEEGVAFPFPQLDVHLDKLEKPAAEQDADAEVEEVQEAEAKEAEAKAKDGK
ncbi:MAG: mechanosensitive ion channel [Synergistaceae bacterium]|nr:mechanosensitive ion channel [Synergistaceae bacterium]